MGWVQAVGKTYPVLRSPLPGGGFGPQTIRKSLVSLILNSGQERYDKVISPVIPFS